MDRGGSQCYRRNGENPAATSWNTKEDIVSKIHLMHHRIGTIQEKVSKEVYSCFDKSRKDILRLIGGKNG